MHGEWSQWYGPEMRCREPGKFEIMPDDIDLMNWQPVKTHRYRAERYAYGSGVPFLVYVHQGLE
jgi:hypothetical protein